MPWFALYTKARNEKKVTEKLQQLGMEAYCPMVTQVKQWSDRKKKVEVPLISSYVFINIAERERAAVYQVPGVVRYMYWLGKPAVIKDVEICALKDALTGTFAAITVSAVAPGTKLKIPTGPFAGQEGIVKFSTAHTLQLLLPELGFTVTLTKAAVTV